MRVCIVVTYDLDEDGGGVKHHAQHLARALRQGGDHVTVIGPSTVARNTPEVVGFRGVINVKSNGSDNRLGLFVSPLSVWKYFQRNRFDAIHIHEPLQPSLPYLASWFTPGIPKICTFHAFSEDASWSLKAGRQICAPVLFPFIGRAIAVSKPAARYASDNWHRPISIIPNGVATDVFHPGARTGANWRPGEGVLRLFFVGRLSDERKGFQFLLEAYVRLRARGIPVSLDAVGEQAGAPLPPAMPGFTYPGAVSLAELVERYRACDVLVAPSTGQESFGIVLLEAMASGRAIICSDIEGYREVVDDEGAVLVKPRDANSIEAAIASLALAPARMERMGEWNRRRVAEFDWQALAPRVRSEYEEAIADPDDPVPIQAAPMIEKTAPVQLDPGLPT
ncbi:MAG: glycosyltransferase family 4 protein [Gemmatimonadaceae bacterium]